MKSWAIALVSRPCRLRGSHQTDNWMRTTSNFSVAASSLEQLKGTAVVGTAMTNLGLERVLAVGGLTLVRVPVGDRYVLEEMLRTGANLGGEQSGHVIFLDDATTGDGLLTALKIACLVVLQGPLDELVKDLKTYPQAILTVKVRSKTQPESLPEV